MTYQAFLPEDQFDICPICHKRTLRTWVEEKTHPLYTYKTEQWVHTECNNCNYKKRPKLIRD